MTQQQLDQFLDAYSRLLVLDLQERFSIGDPRVCLSDADGRFLLQMASVLAFGPDDKDEVVSAQWKGWSYDVATRLAVAKNGRDDRFVQAAEMILARLGNFPGRDYLRKVYPASLGVALSPTLVLEAIVREEDNTLTFAGIGQRTLTDFQVSLVDRLRSTKAVSVSAPTSAGKSFALTLDIIDELATGRSKVIVYVVPTRALIRQVMNDLLANLRSANLSDVAVSSAPIPLDDDDLRKGIVYVFTQERLSSLLYFNSEVPKIDRLYVDESQEIGDAERGMILHTVVQDVIRGYPEAKLCFASPLTSNPDFLFGEFEMSAVGEAFVERLSPVAQNVITLSKVAGETKVADVSLRTPAGNRAVGRLRLDYAFRGVAQCLANTALLCTKDDESTIVYANDSSEAVDIATHIAEKIEKDVDFPEVFAFRDFVKQHVHARYALVDTLPKGVAFHYGKMPHILRAQVEDLLKQGKLKYVASTSTLLQGINLPAKNIVVREPRLGPGNPMESSDFWNLAGRAGRLREAFNGNIWCLDPSGWENTPLEGPALSEMTSAFRTSLEDPVVVDSLVASIDDNELLHKVENREQVEQVFGKIFSEYTCEDASVGDSTFATGADAAKMAVVDEKCRALASSLVVPKSVCSRNSTISPNSLNTLWRRFSASAHITSMIPLDPYAENALDNHRAVFQTIDQVFSGWQNRRHVYFASLGYHWMMGRSLKDLIANHLSFNKVEEKDRNAVNTSIRAFLDNLEQMLRFRYVRYLKAYNDTLTEFLSRTNKAGLIAQIAPLHVYIEFGARDRVLVMLMSIGLSRSTAILIRSLITSTSDISRRDCWRKLMELPLKSLAIPEVCKTEIRQLRGKS